jgi:PKD repeat protein
MSTRTTIAGSALLLAVAAACSGDAPTASSTSGELRRSAALADGGAAIISNGTLKLGVDRTGFIGVEGRFNENDNPRDSIALRYLPANADGLIVDDGATSYGVEGWGLAAFYEPTLAITAEAHSSGFDGQRAGLDLVSFTSTANSAVSVTTIRKPSAAAPFVRITHDFHPAAATPNLYEVAVTFENVSDLAVSDLRYTRQAYWRINRSFATFATMQGTAGEPLVARATDGGAGFSPRSSARGPIVAGAVGDFTDVGPNNHGAHLDLALGELGPGDEKTIYLYFGAAAGEAAALEAVDDVGANVYALGQSAASGAPLTFVLAFTGESNASPVARTNGPFTARLGETIQFSGEGSFDPDGDALTYSWDFGDGTTAAGKEVSHAYTLQRSGFNVVLTVTDPSGATGTASTPVTLEAANQPPIAVPNGPYAGDVGAQIAFSSEGSRDPEGGAITYKWEFGDGESSTEANPTHPYDADGTYVARLTVTDPQGLTGTATVQVVVGPVNHPPVPAIDGPTDGTTGAPVAFTTSASDPDGDSPLACAIDYGDGGGFVAMPGCAAGGSHSYAAAGGYTVTIRATDPTGAIGTATHLVSVGASEPPPVCGPGSGEAPALRLHRAYSRTEVGPFADRIPNVEMLHFGFGDRDCGPWRARIDWGDGHVDEFALDGNLGPADNYVAYHDYGAAGSYVVKMTITDAAGLASAEQSITMTAAPAVAASR